MTYVNNYHRRHGPVRDAVEAWLSRADDGMEFHLNDIVADLDLQLSSISGVLRTMARNNEGVTVTARRGWYRKDPVPARVPVRAADPVPAADPGLAPIPALLPEPSPQGLKPGDLMEVVGVFKSGHVLLRAAGSEKLYTAEEAEL